MPISKGSGLNAEWGESPREPVTVKLQLWEISQIRACAWNGSDASSTVCFLPTEQYLPAGGIRRAGLCGCRFRYPGKKIHVKCSTLRDKHQDACDTKTFGDRLTRNLMANEHKKTADTVSYRRAKIYCFLRAMRRSAKCRRSGCSGACSQATDGHIILM